MTSADTARTAADRVWAALPAGTRSVLTDGLSPTDLQTLLLDLARTRAARVDPPRLVRRWTEDRFVSPSSVNPRRLAALVATAWDRLPTEFVGIELAPVAPLGTCAAVGATDQNRIVSTVRTSEVVSDPTNVLALEAVRRRSGAGDVHLAAHHRVLRAQRFGSGNAAHFSLFALVSSGRDRGSRATELDFVGRHLSAWRTLLEATLGEGSCSVTYTTGAPYYAGLRFKILARTPTGPYEIGDGGLTDWTARLRADAKERCLISCVATERWLGLVPDPDPRTAVAG
jgi:hypothetical protein